MVDKEVSSRSAWTDRDKLVYVFLLLESSGPINWSQVPVPAGRTMTACKRMVDKLKGQLKADIDRMKLGSEETMSKGKEINFSPNGTKKRKAQEIEE